jgi:hypothetical protein
MFGISSEFAEAVGLVADLAVPAVVIGYGLWRFTRAVVFGNTLSPETNVAYTRYVPTGDVNPNTGNEFYRQELFTIAAKLDFAEMFNKMTVGWVSRKLKAAAGKCTNEMPLVFSFMNNAIFVLNDADKQMQRLIVPKFKGAIGGILQASFGDKLPVSHKIGVSMRVDTYAALTFELGAKRREFRTLILNKEQVHGATPGQGGLPNIADTLFLDYADGQYKADPKLPQADRLRTNMAIRDELLENAAMRANMGVYYFADKLAL